MDVRNEMSSLKLTGAFLLLASCGGFGAARVITIRKTIADIHELRQAVERMETEICIRCRPLPETAALLGSVFPRCFSGIRDVKSSLRDEPFVLVWKKHFQSMDLPTDAESAIIILGEELSCGAVPEKAFSVCAHHLRSAEETLGKKLAENGKVYIASGIAAGCLLVIALI